MSRFLSTAILLSLMTGEVTGSGVRVFPSALRDGVLVIQTYYPEPVNDPLGSFTWEIAEGEASAAASADDCLLDGVPPRMDCSPEDRVFFYRMKSPSVAISAFRVNRSEIVAVWDRPLNEGRLYEREDGKWTLRDRFPGVAGAPYVTVGRGGRVAFPMDWNMWRERSSSGGQVIGVTQKGRLILRVGAGEPERVLYEAGQRDGGFWELLSLDASPEDARVLCLRTSRDDPMAVEVNLDSGQESRKWRLPTVLETARSLGDITNGWRGARWGSVIRIRHASYLVLSEDLHVSAREPLEAEFVALELTTGEPVPRRIRVR
jgi:hypothetical protein